MRRKTLTAAVLRKVKGPRKIGTLAGSHAAYRGRWIRSPFLPSRIDLEPNNHCNLRCPHCQVTYWTKSRAVLDPGRFRAVLAQFPRLLSVKLQGMGEPFLNPHLLDMLSEADRRRVSTQVITNGTVLPADAIEGLVALGRTHICFSVDGASAAVHEGIRIGSRFDRILANVAALIARRGDGGAPLVSLTTVVTNGNVGELPGIVRLGKRLGVDSLSFQTFLTHWGKKEVEEANERIRLPLGSGELDASLREVRRVARECRMPVTLRFGDYYMKRRPCPWPWTRTFIAANGDVVPCCIIADSDVIRMGNLFEEDFSVIWNSPAYRDFRRRIRTHDLHDFCRNCYLD